MTRLESFTDFPEMTRVPFVQKTRITKEVTRSNPTSSYVTLTDESFYSPFFHHPFFILLGDVLQWHQVLLVIAVTTPVPIDGYHVVRYSSLITIRFLYAII